MSPRYDDLRSAWVLAVPLVLLAAGCAAPAGTEGETRGGSQEPVVEEPEGTRRPATFLGLDCDSRAAAITLPMDTNPGTAPEGWEPRGFYLESSIHLDLWVCQRFSWGGFERQEVRLVLEGHNHFTPPESCRLDESVLRWHILANAWIDDPDLVEALNEDWELPVRFAKIHLDEDLDGAPRAAVFSWNSGASSDNRLEFRQAGDSSGRNFHDLRYTYEGGRGLYHLVLQPEPGWPSVDLFAAVGAVTPPLLSYEATGGPYAGTAAWYTDTELPGRILHFSDRLCQERLP